MADDGVPGIGLTLPTWPLRGGGHATWAELRGLALGAEALGVDTLWVPDHLQRTVPGRPTFGFWECWTILAAAAAVTNRIGIGPFVASTGFRNPALLAKMAATLDEVSGGRLVLGLGSGNPATDESWQAFGFETAAPVSRFSESVEVVARLLREPPVTFSGEYVRVDGADILPRGPRDRVPVWVGGKGDRILGIAARWADAVNGNVALTGADDARAMVARAAAACERIGRDPATLAVTGWARLALAADGSAVARDGRLAGSPAEVAATLRAVRAAGVSHVTLYLGDADDPSPLPALTAPVLERFAPILRALQAG
jgi:alkanesulfonate monooxygenase SsuD/methylene tetrahydromethanopterin reductase-like flavin-dependent oxidoreductase (luciferase family)